MSDDTRIKHGLRLAIKASGKTMRGVSLALGMEPTYVSRQLRRNKNHTNTFINNILTAVGVCRADFEAFLRGRLGEDPRLHLQEIVNEGPFSRPKLNSVREGPLVGDWKDLDSLVRRLGRVERVQELCWHVQHGTSESKAEAWSLLGAMARSEGSERRAAWCYLRSIQEWMSGKGAQDLYGRILLRIGRLFISTARLALVEECFQLALPRLGTSGEPKWVARAAFNLGVVAFYQGRYQEALMWIEVVDRLPKDCFLEIPALHCKGMSLMRIGEYAAALEVCGQIAAEIGVQDFFVQLLLGGCYEGQGRLYEALSAYCKADNLTAFEGVDVLNALELRLCSIRCRIAMGQSGKDLAYDLTMLKRNALSVSKRFAKLYCVEVGRLVALREALDLDSVLLRMRVDIRKLRAS